MRAIESILLVLSLLRDHASRSESTALLCSAVDEVDPALREIKIDFSHGTDTFLAYIRPNITTFYQGDAPASKPVVPLYQGLAGKFSNMGNELLRLYREPGAGKPSELVGRAEPFQSVGTATYPGHKFFFTPEDDINRRVIEFEVKKGISNYFYDPYEVERDPDATQDYIDALPLSEFQLYEKHRRNRIFNKKYFEMTGREYLAMYPRPRPSHHMWRADYFNQQHWVISKETHFWTLPPSDVLGEMGLHRKKRSILDDGLPLLNEYRTGKPTMNMTMTVLSCAPRVFEIDNFLSGVEVDHILQLTGADPPSSTSSYGKRQDTLVEREKSPIVDAIYRRSADLLLIDEALLRHRGDGEYADIDTKESIAAPLQLVHHVPGQDHQASHDFNYDSFHRPTQAARFATLLLYLNEEMKGGETSFPRWVNGETFKDLRIVPKKGKAVLFYSQLPDGNMDDLSQHGSLPVQGGEKWLMNLWVYDPVH